MNTIASNLANARTTRTEQGGPYRRLDPVFEAKGFSRIGFRLIRRVISVRYNGEDELTPQQVAQIFVALLAISLHRLRFPLPAETLPADPVV